MELIKVREKIIKAAPNFLKEEKGILWLLLTAALVVGLQKLLQGPATYNSYIIFKSSFFHLYYDQNLYGGYPDEYFDEYLYSPTFALLMAPLVYLPLWLQVILWCCLNAVCVYAAIKLFPFDDGRKRIAICLFILLEFITSIQNMQVAPMIGAFIILAFIFFERGNLFKAAFFIILASFIKIYAIISVVLFLMYPKRLKFIAYILFWGIVFVLAPLLIVSPNVLTFQYHSWYNTTMLIHQSEDTGINPNVVLPVSFMSWFKVWFHVTLPSLYVQIIGTILLLLPLFRTRCFKNREFRMLILPSILIWAIIFNHIAESASYIVAILGVGIWYAAVKKDKLSMFFLITIFILSVLSPTSLFPKCLRDHYIVPYVLKAFPCILLWFNIQYRLLFSKFNTASELGVSAI